MIALPFLSFSTQTVAGAFGSSFLGATDGCAETDTVKSNAVRNVIKCLNIIVSFVYNITIRFRVPDQNVQKSDLILVNCRGHVY
jgi:hypothetical protein